MQKISSSYCEVQFPIRGSFIPKDFHYFLHASLCKELEGRHGVRSFPFILSGVRAVERQLVVGSKTRLTFRVFGDDLSKVLTLTNKVLNIGGVEVQLGLPQRFELRASPSLDCRLVVFNLQYLKDHKDLTFEETRQLYENRCMDELQVFGIERPQFSLGKVSAPLRLKGRSIYGFSVRVLDLDPRSSLRLLEEGLGGKRNMGCGVFRPTRVFG